MKIKIEDRYSNDFDDTASVYGQAVYGVDDKGTVRLDVKDTKS